MLSSELSRSSIVSSLCAKLSICWLNLDCESGISVHLQIFSITPKLRLFLLNSCQLHTCYPQQISTLWTKWAEKLTLPTIAALWWPDANVAPKHSLTFTRFSLTLSHFVHEVSSWFIKRCGWGLKLIKCQSQLTGLNQVLRCHGDDSGFIDRALYFVVAGVHFVKPSYEMWFGMCQCGTFRSGEV